MSPVVEWVITLTLMPAAGYALIGACRAARWLGEGRRVAPPPEPIDQLAADLRRLRADLEDTETRAGLTAKYHRVQAVRGAYLDALSAACQRLDISPPPGDGAPLTEIYRVEAALRQRGLDVRPQNGGTLLRAGGGARRLQDLGEHALEVRTRGGGADVPSGPLRHVPPMLEDSWKISAEARRPRRSARITATTGS